MRPTPFFRRILLLLLAFLLGTIRAQAQAPQQQDGLFDGAAKDDVGGKNNGGGAGGGGGKNGAGGGGVGGGKGPGAAAAVEIPSWPSLAPCNMSYAELEATENTDPIGPCIFTDTLPQIEADMAKLQLQASPTDPLFYENRTTSVVTIAGVMERKCGIYNAGALVAVEKLNESNQGRGFSIGYNKDRYVKFRLVTVLVGGVTAVGGQRTYAGLHMAHLDQMLTSLEPQYILGACSKSGSFDKPLAGKHKTIVLSNGGPQTFYTEDSNDYVFGTFVPVETYGQSALRAMTLAHPDRNQRAKIKIRTIRQVEAQLHNETCGAIRDRASEEGFDTKDILFRSRGDIDGDGTENRYDYHYLNGTLADEACGREEGGDGNAIFVCVPGEREMNALMDRWKDNGCRPSLLWSAVAGKDWQIGRIDEMPYIMTDGQWHPHMTYSDEFFESGLAMLNYMEQKHGVRSPYGAAMGPYHSIYIMYMNIWHHFKTQDSPDVEATFKERYEVMRRSMLNLFLESSLYGPTSFDKDRRNVGRASAGMQFQIPLDSTTGEAELMLVSPADQARVGIAYPAPASTSCGAGEYIDETSVKEGISLLERKCSKCPVDTFQPSTNNDFGCRACPEGSGTAGDTGADVCVAMDENLVPQGMITFGCVIVGVNFLLAITFAAWTIKYRNDPVVRLGQKEFLLLLCCGSFLSSSSIIPLSLQAGIFDDDAAKAASAACTAVPWLYSTGWILQYSSLFAKSFRMRQVMKATRRMRQVKVTAKQTLLFVLAALMLNYAIIIPWTVIDPYTWERVELGVTVDKDAGVITYESVGNCSSEHLGAWLGSMLGYHLCIMLATNWILWTLRFMNDRYQESKYVTLASLFACEFLLMGVPIMIAVGDSSQLRYIVLVLIIAFSDMGILLFVFIPKIKFQRKGLPEGTSVMGSVMGPNSINSNASGISGLNCNRKSMAPSHCGKCATKLKLCCDQCHPEVIPFITNASKEVVTAIPNPPCMPVAKTNEDTNMAKSVKSEITNSSVTEADVVGESGNAASALQTISECNSVEDHIEDVLVPESPGEDMPESARPNDDAPV